MNNFLAKIFGGQQKKESKPAAAAASQEPKKEVDGLYDNMELYEQSHITLQNPPPIPASSPILPPPKSPQPEGKEKEKKERRIQSSSGASVDSNSKPSAATAVQAKKIDSSNPPAPKATYGSAPVPQLQQVQTKPGQVPRFYPVGHGPGSPAKTPQQGKK